MDNIEKIMKETFTRLAAADCLERMKQDFAELGITIEYKITEIDIEKLDKLAKAYQNNLKNGDSPFESVDKIFGKKSQDVQESVVSEQLLKYFDDLEKKNETTKTDN